MLTFRGWVDLKAHGSVGGTTEKIPSDTTGNRSRVVAKCVNHYATPDPTQLYVPVLLYHTGTYNRLPADEPLCSIHVEDIANIKILFDVFLTVHHI